jgi:ADP-ribose pyrophosphatase YjhB (NUDIX family)
VADAGQPGATGWATPSDWYASLAGVVVAAAAMITDPRGRVLLVKPNYRDRWSLPGGVCEFGEPPDVGCAREVNEELGLDIGLGELLVVDWAQPYGAEVRPILSFVFDGGELPGGERIVLQEAELDGFSFCEPAHFGDYLPPFLMARLTGALRARQQGAAVYLPQQRRAGGAQDKLS